MVSVSGKITAEFISKLKSGNDVRPDQVAKLEALFTQGQVPKVDEVVALFSLDPPPPAAAEGDGK